MGTYCTLKHPNYIMMLSLFPISLRKAGVEGSNPFFSTIISRGCKLCLRPLFCSGALRAGTLGVHVPVCGKCCRSPELLRKSADMAQGTGGRRAPRARRRGGGGFCGADEKNGHMPGIAVEDSKIVCARMKAAYLLRAFRARSRRVFSVYAAARAGPLFAVFSFHPSVCKCQAEVPDECSSASECRFQARDCWHRCDIVCHYGNTGCPGSHVSQSAHL